MKLTIVTPEGVVCQAEAESVTLPGALGRFVVLKNHAPLMSLLECGDVVYMEQGEERRVAIRSGVVNVHNNEIEVCAEVDTTSVKK